MRRVHLRTIDVAWTRIIKRDTSSIAVVAHRGQVCSTLLNLFLELLLHLVKQAEQVFIVRLNFAFHDLGEAVSRADFAAIDDLLVFQRGKILLDLQLVALMNSVHVLERLTQRLRHLLVEVLVMALMLPDAVRDELIRARLLDVVVEPRQVKLVHAEANQVQKRLNVVDGCRIRVQLVLAQRSEH